MTVKLKAAPIFSDRMVLQRDTSVFVWGTGAEGAVVAAQVGGNRAEATVKDGRWWLSLPPMPAGGPHELTLSSEEDRIVFTDVLFGDVWLAGGQSNMEWSLRDAAESKDAIPNAEHPDIRLLHVPRISYEEPGDEDAAMTWQACTPESAAAFSAVAYFFGGELQRELGVPIGLISCNWGGTSASCWVDQSTLQGDEELRVYWDEHEARMKDFTWEAYEQADREYQQAVNDYVQREREGKTGEELGAYPWPPVYGPKVFYRPCGLYDTMLSKVSPYPLKGFIYYQGESDAHRPALYDKLLEALIRKWRSDWEDAELPFLFVQLPFWDNEGHPDGEAWPLLRESQQKVADRVPHTGMAVALDCGEERDIHPRRKQPIGHRLALVALEKVYGCNVQSSGPKPASARADGNKAVISFEHAGSGLGSGGARLKGFHICGEDGAFLPAEAALSGNTVTVWNENVSKPAAVRYGWANYMEANLYNSHGLPAAPFRMTLS
ncbi:sialate O-acetylesterase [Paenibacillus thermotolerans]|uniref:sialate O-acetylesterase n=1 Tax=Paenibacillus thermotolerans TaxID=3027807 RepID=UPI002368EF35|nr:MULTISPECIES: sialate O-acetylesterase [unclassified Paenibacillus]